VQKNIFGVVYICNTNIKTYKGNTSSWSYHLQHCVRTSNLQIEWSRRQLRHMTVKDQAHRCKSFGTPASLVSNILTVEDSGTDSIDYL